MDTDVSRLPILALEAIRQTPSADEIEAASKPPYPIPSCYVTFASAARAALSERIKNGGPNPMCSRRLNETACKFDNTAWYILKNYKPFLSFHISDMLCMLLAGGIISINAIQNIALSCEDRDTSCFMQRAIVYRNLADGDIDAAKIAADHPIFGDNTWVGWRAIGEHYAADADVESFLRLWTKYEARQERYWIDCMRRTLVMSVSRKYGWREAVALTKNKKIGTKKRDYNMISIALCPIAQTGDTATLRMLFASETVLADLEEIERLSLLVTAMNATISKPPKTDHPELGEILSRIIAIDPTISKQQSRERDGLLLNCWPLIGEQSTLKRVRAALRAPSHRRELSKLYREHST